MPSLQCPDCGHREPLEGIGDVATFRCGGCGRALKVPAQFRSPAPSPVANGNGTGRARRVAPAATAATGAGAATPSARSGPVTGSGAVLGQVPLDPAPADAFESAPLGSTGSTGAVGLGAVGSAGAPRALGRLEQLDANGAPIGDLAVPPPTGPAARVVGGRAQVPWYWRTLVWVLALPFSLLVVFEGAIRLHFLTKTNLEDTFITTGWDRFVPVARLLPIAAVLTAVIVQVSITYLERRAAGVAGRSGRRRPPRSRPASRPGPGAGVTGS